MVLTRRQAEVLRLIVGEYVTTGNPVGSLTIAQRYLPQVSPATIRNDMADLEEAGYITHWHTSSGRLPSDRGYRYFVESLMPEVVLPAVTQRTIRHQFHQVEMEMDEWARLAASVLASTLRNVALATVPQTARARLRRVELVPIHDQLLLLQVVLEDARVRQQMVALEEARDQEELRQTEQRLNIAYVGCTAEQVRQLQVPLEAWQAKLREALLGLLQAEERHAEDEAHLYGLPFMLSQPEFARMELALELVRLFEDRTPLREVLESAPVGPEVAVIIGAENPKATMQLCTVVLSRYGRQGRVGGVLGVVGPTRMHYGETIATVRYLSSLMTELLGEIYG